MLLARGQSIVFAVTVATKLDILDEKSGNFRKPSQNLKITLNWKSSSFSYGCVASVSLTVQCFYMQGTVVMQKYN